MKYKYRILYYPPHNTLENNNPDTWRKVFLINRYDCREELDLVVKIKELILDYNMNPEYVIVEDLDTEESFFYLSKKEVTFNKYSFIEFDN